jgi:hypothetical protein
LLPIEPETAWIEALRHASRRLPPGDPLAQLFHEDREDLRIVVESDRVREIVGTRARGLSARVRSGLVYRSEPDPADAWSLAGQVTGSFPALASGSRTSDATVHLSTTDALRFVGELIAEVSRIAKTEPVRAQVRWVGFRQSVSIGRPDGTIRSDVRQGSRVRLEVELAHERSRGRAVVEASLRERAAGTISELAARACRRAREARGPPAPRACPY